MRDPFGTANDYFAVVSVGDAFLSTSGTYEKQFTVDGKTYHHLLDLTTGYPAETTLCSVTVLAETGLCKATRFRPFAFCWGRKRHVKY